MSLTDAQWEIAHAIAQTLVKENTDVNELGKAVAYLRASIQQPDATSRFFKYLKTLVSNARQIGHSGRTTDYYRSIDKACSDYLKGIQDAYTILQILGWVSRLMRYYKDAGLPIGEIQPPSGLKRCSPANKTGDYCPSTHYLRAPITLSHRETL